MTLKKNDPKEVLEAGLQALEEAHDAHALEAVWREYTGRRGIFKEMLRDIKKLPKRERSAYGKEVHAAIERFEQEAQERTEALARRETPSEVSEHIDVTLPVQPLLRGAVHPLTKTRQRTEDIFASMGFAVVEGPEVEEERYNFDALNFPPDHPARDLQDTFWLRKDGEQARKASKREKKDKKQSHAFADSPSRLLLRTHTSPVQVRFMEQNQPPFRIVIPGEVYRNDATDASHDLQFTQIEGLMVNYRDAVEPVTLKTLVSVLQTFFEHFFQTKTAVRFRPSYFPFTEPSIEFDLSCVICEGKGCSVCSRTGWLEIGGAGMVHPNVFEASGYNPKEVQGFAFGFGLDRIALLKHRIDDIRLFRSGDMAFVEQFR